MPTDEERADFKRAEYERIKPAFLSEGAPRAEGLPHKTDCPLLAAGIEHEGFCPTDERWRIRAAPRAEGLDVPPSNLLAEAMHSTRTPGHDSHAIEECIDHTYSLEAWAERVHDWLARLARPSDERVPEEDR